MDDRMERLLFLYELLHKANNKVEVSCSDSSSSTCSATMSNSETIPSRNYTRFANPLLSFKQKKNWDISSGASTGSRLSKVSYGTTRPASSLSHPLPQHHPVLSSKPDPVSQSPVNAMPRKGSNSNSNTVHPEETLQKNKEGRLGWSEWLFGKLM